MKGNNSGLFFLLLVLVVCVGCSSGRVYSPVFSDDGQVVAFSDEQWPQVWVADAKGVRKVADAQRFALSRDGHYILTIDSSDHELRPGLRLTVREVASKKEFHTLLPDAPAEARNLADGRSWLEASPAEVFIEPGPAVVFSLWAYRGPPGAFALPESQARLEAMTKAAATPPASWKSSGTVTEMVYLRWHPGDAWKQVERPGDQYRTVLQPIAYGGPDAAALPIVELGCDGRNARRTIWVRPDGTAIELVRQNDVPTRFLITLPWMPLFFWNSMYWATLLDPFADLAASDQAQPQARVDELVRRAKQAPVHPDR